MIKNIGIWISTMRLRTLPLSLSGIILASFLAAHQGVFHLGIFILSMFTTLSLQILSNLANDYGDGVKGTDNKDRIGPERAIQSGKITPQSMLLGIKINAALCAILSIALIFTAFGFKQFIYILIFLCLGIAAVVAAIKYTVGKNAYGYRALGDVFVFIFFGLVSVIGCYFLYAKTIDFIVVLPACVIGLLSVGVLNLNNMRDIVSDKKSNKITLAVKLGSKKIKKYHYFLILTAVLLTVVFGFLYYRSPLNFIFLLAFVPLLIHLITVNKNKEPRNLNPELKKLALTTFALAILLGLGFML